MKENRAHGTADHSGTEGVADATVLIVPVADGRRVAMEREGLPFTMTEAAGAGVLAALAC